MADDESRSWEDVLRALLGDEGARNALEAMREAGMDPDAMGQAAGLPTDPTQLQAMISQVQAMMATSGDGPVNWTLAHDVARQQVFAASDPAPTAAQEARVRHYLQIADLWLDPVTDVVGRSPRREALSRAAWVQAALPTFQTLAEPVAANVVRAIVTVLKSHGEAVSGLGMAGVDAENLLARLGGATFGMQLGTAVATLATEAFGYGDIGLPLVADQAVALVPHNIDEFADGLEIPSDEISQFLAVREVATARLYAGAPWLRAHLLSLVENYAREITIDLEAMEEAVREIDPSDPEQLREAMSGGVFALDLTDVQRAALANLETTLAVIEGWVEEVTRLATEGQLPHAVPLAEMMRRRRAAGGPAEETFKSLIGLELRPRRSREASTLWATLTREWGATERDRLWSHPDLMPSAEELDDPAGIVAARAGGVDTEFDDALEALLAEADGTADSDPTTDADDDPETDAAPDTDDDAAGGENT